ncbi:protein of unknown function [Burkholderia multivorans]
MRRVAQPVLLSAGKSTTMSLPTMSARHAAIPSPTFADICGAPRRRLQLFVAHSSNLWPDSARPAPKFPLISTNTYPLHPEARARQLSGELPMNQPTRLTPLFNPGRLLITRVALTALRANGIPVISVVLRHIAVDWGIVSDDDRRQNDLSITAGLVVRARFMRLVAALLTVPVLALAGTSIGRRIVIRFVLAHEALVPGPSLNQRAIHAEMFARQVAARLRRLDGLVEQTYDDIVNEQPVTVLAERRVVPHRIVHRQADEPAKQHVVGDLLHQHAFASNRIQHLQQQRTNQLLRGDARAAALRVALVHPREHRVHALERVVQPNANRAQRVIGRHEVIQSRHCEHRLGVAVRSAHRFGLRVVRFPVSTFTAPGRMTTAGAISTAC